MKRLRTIRILLSILFFVSAIGCLFLGLDHHPLSIVVRNSQVVPSLISMTFGATLFWLVATWCLGRVYCSSVCPVGTLIDLFIPLKKFFPGAAKRYRYKHPGKIRYHILIIYCISLGGLAIVPILLEPWRMMQTMAGTLREGAMPHEWSALGIGAGVGAAAGIVSFAALALSAVYFGRDFCNVVCPLGTLMSLAESKTLYHIEIDPDRCAGCLKCEEACKASCVKVVSRYVDNSRCVRCFDCLAVCPEDAIRYQRDRNRPATPMMRRKTGASR